VLVTHHVEEIPPTAEQLLAVRSGRIVASGPVGTTLDADLLERLFDVRVRLQHRGGRWMIGPAKD
jgi:iron complex transport system ATP-binding protein